MACNHRGTGRMGDVGGPLDICGTCGKRVPAPAPSTTGLRHKPTGRMVAVGDTLLDFRGDAHVIRGWYGKPAPSTGRVATSVVTSVGTYYPGVIDCEIIDIPGR